MIRSLFAVLLTALLAVAFDVPPARAAQIPSLGLDAITVTPTTRLPKGLRVGEGALVIAVREGSPAAAAGIKAGDVIIMAGSERVKTAEQLADIAARSSDQSLSLTRVRAGARPETVAVQLTPEKGLGQIGTGTGGGGTGGGIGGGIGIPPRPGFGAGQPSGGAAPPPPPVVVAPEPPPPAVAPPPSGGQGAPAPRPYYRTVEPGEEPSGSGAPAEPRSSDNDGMGAPLDDGPVVGSPAPEEPTVGSPEEPVGEAPPATRGLGGGEEDSKDYSVVRVHYATDRNRTGSTDPAEYFGGDRSTLQYGICDVTVPKDHRVGELESPSYLRLEFSEDPKKHVILSAIEEQNAGVFYDDIQDRIAASRGKSAFIFVHGYNVTFKDAARRTAQMAYDLKFDGAPVFFSWPSQGSLVGYTIDEANIEYAKSDLKAFIAEFTRTSKAEQIYLVAHSMGNRALTGAVADLFRDAPDVKAKIKEVILAAPDVDAAVFKRDIAPMIAGQGQAVTLYASSNDWALKASKKFHGYPRAGDTGASLTVVPGIATIDSSEVETDFLGHSYFAESTSIISDIFDILSGRTKPEDRTHLVPVEAAFGKYWKIQKGR